MKVRCVLAGIGVKITRRDEYSFAGFLAGERADEVLDLWPSHIVFPTLGLDVDHIEPEAIFVNHTVDSLVAGLLCDLRGFRA